MSGIRTGTRLEQLRLLHARVGQEIATLERQEALEARPAPPPRRRRVRAAANQPDRATAALLRLGVTAYEVKEWALDVGLITAIRRGKVSFVIIDQYETAHQ